VPGAWLTTFNATRMVLYATVGTIEALCLFPRYSSILRSSDTVERRAEHVEVRQFIEGASSTADRLAQHLQRDPLGAVRKLWDYRGLTPPFKVLFKIGIERHGRKASGTGRGPPIYRGRLQHRRALCSTPSTRPARYCTPPFGLPRLDASF
jgi:hypothetical protein